MRDLIGIGIAVMDVLLLLDRFPLEDEKQRADARLTQGGGQCATALCCAARLGVDCAYMGVVGDDEPARFLLGEFRRFGVGLEHAAVAPGRDTTVSYVLINRAAATRTCVWAEGSAPSLEPEALDEAALRGCRILHLDGHCARAAARGA